MSDLTVPKSSSVTALRDRVIATGLVLLALFILYLVFLDQGALLSPILGEAAHAENYLHEFTHDGRHLLAAQCH